MDTNQLIQNISSSLDIEPDRAKNMLRHFISIFAGHGEKLENVEVPGFGAFDFGLRGEREVVHPATGQHMLIPPKVIMNFRPTKLLNTKINHGQ